MEQAIISLVSVVLVVMLYLDRGHRASFRRVDQKFVELEAKLENKIDESARRTDARIDDLSRSVDARLSEFNARMIELSTRMSDLSSSVDVRISDLSRSVFAFTHSGGRAEAHAESLAGVE